MFFRKKLEERDIKTTTASFGVLDLGISWIDEPNDGAYNWWELEMITDQDECVGHPERTEAGGQGNLGSLVNYTVIEFAAKEEWTRCQQISLNNTEKRKRLTGR